VNTAKFKLVYLTGCSHKLNIKEYINYSFDVKFFPIFDIRSKDINFSIQHPININRNKKYMFINAKDTPHRRYILGSLIKNNLLNDGIVSYKCTEGFNPRNLDLNENLGYTQQQLKTADDLFLATEPYIPLLLKGIVNNYIRHLYQEPYVNIVGETHFSNRLYTFNTSFVTEKTFNAIANNQIFIVVGHTNSLDLLKSLGYKTFDSIVDESYDAIQDNGVRLETVAKEIIRFVSRPIEQIKEDYIKVIDIIKHNRDLLLSQDLTKRLQDFINENYA